MLYFFRFLRNIALIFDKKNSYSIGNKISLLTTYLSLKFLQSTKFLKKKKNQIKLLKYNVNYLNFDIVVTLFESIFLNHEYRFESNKKKPIIFDIGGNIGVSILYFKFLFPQSLLTVFEPDLDSFNILKSNVKQNNLKGIFLINQAVTDKQGNADFYYDPVNRGALLMGLSRNRLPNAKIRKVKTTSLSKYINQPVDLIKIDAEGSETTIILNLWRTNKMKLIKKMIIEYHHHIQPFSDNLSQILKILEGNNFGYQMVTPLRSPIKESSYQDILIYAYNKKKSS